MAESIEERLNRLEAEIKRQRNVNQALRNQLLSLLNFLLSWSVSGKEQTRLKTIALALERLNPGGYRKTH